MHNASRRELRIGLAKLQSRQTFTNAQQFRPVSVTYIPLLQNELGTFPFRRIIAIEPVGLNQRLENALHKIIFFWSQCLEHDDPSATNAEPSRADGRSAHDGQRSHTGDLFPTIDRVPEVSRYEPRLYENDKMAVHARELPPCSSSRDTRFGSAGAARKACNRDFAHKAYLERRLFRNYCSCDREP